MGSKSKQYGHSFEYEIRDLLREHTGLLEFERVPGGGAWTGGSNQYKVETNRDDVIEILSSDIICPKNWRWSVECKNYEDLGIHQLVLGHGSNLIDGFLSQVTQDAGIAHKQPLLVMKLRKKGFKLPSRVTKLLDAANIKPPKSNSITIGRFAAEKVEFSQDLQDVNYIFYRQHKKDGSIVRWRFFDLEEWLKKVKDRQFLK